MKKLKINLIFVSVILISITAYSQSEKDKELKQELIGTWEFVELRDSNGNKVDTIWHNVVGGWEIPKGPLRTYRADGTYSTQFTPKNTDNGKWYYDKEKKAIIQMLYYEKPYSGAAKYLIDKGHAKKDKNGDYYEIITDEVSELTDNKLIILEREDRKRIFSKKEE